jgi:hypothetical protein
VLTCLLFMCLCAAHEDELPSSAQPNGLQHSNDAQWFFHSSNVRFIPSRPLPGHTSVAIGSQGGLWKHIILGAGKVQVECLQLN